VIKSLFSELRGNIREPNSCLEGIFFSEISARNFDALPTDPAQDQQFLRYHRTSVLMRAGFDSSPVGARPATRK
jgi:hypothetical protein